MATPESAPPKYQQEVSTASKQYPKLGGTFWWLLLGLMLISDMGCILFDLLVTGGLGLSLTGVGAIIGIPLFIIAWVGGIFLALNAFVFSSGYYLFNHVSLFEARKLATWGVSAIIKLLPEINMVPTLTISFLVVTFMENAKRGSGILGAVAQKAVTVAGPVSKV